MHCWMSSGIIDNPPPLGSIITVKHSGYYKNGTLRHPFYWREKTEIPCIASERKPLVLILKSFLIVRLRLLIGQS